MAGSHQQGVLCIYATQFLKQGWPCILARTTYRGRELHGWCIGWEMPIGAKKPPIEEMPAIGTAIELKQQHGKSNRDGLAFQQDGLHQWQMPIAEAIVWSR